jgi:hypothetical protein
MMYPCNRHARRRGYEVAESYGAADVAASHACHDGVNLPVVKPGVRALDAPLWAALLAAAHVTAITCAMQAKECGMNTGVVPPGLRGCSGDASWP